MSKFLSVFLSFLSTILVLGNVRALPPTRMGVREILEVIPKAVRSLSTLRGSRPTKPIDQAPFERVDRIFSTPVRFLDPSGEVFKRPSHAPLLEAYSPEETKVDSHTVRIDLKKSKRRSSLSR